MTNHSSRGSSERILVTGGSDFIGTNLVEFGIAHGDFVENFDIAPPRNPRHAEHWREGDVLDAASLKRAFKTFAPTVVQHMAARADLVGRSLDEYAANTRGVENLIEAVAVNPSVRRVVFASSRMVCRIGYQPEHDEDYCPATVYGESKVEMERIVRSANLGVDWVIIRPTSIWGPWFDVPYRDFFLSIARGRYFHVEERRVLKSFGFVGNTVYQLDRIASAPREAVHGRTMYVADYPPLEVRSWAERIRRELGAPRIRTLPHPVLKAVARVGDLAARLGWEHVPLTSFRLGNLLTEMIYDLRPLQELAGELPWTLDDGVVQTVAWLRQQGHV